MSFNAPDIRQFKLTGSTVGDIYFPRNALLLPFDGSNGATTTSDSSNSNHTATFNGNAQISTCLLYTSPSPRDRTRSRMPSSA